MRETERLALFRSITVILITIFLSNVTFSQRYPNQDVDKLLNEGIEGVINQNYDAAKTKFSLLDSKYPQIPFGKIYLAVVEITKAFDYGEEFNFEKISKNLEEALKLSENLHEQNPSSIWNNYFVALSKGYKAYLQVLNGEWLSAILEGLSSVDYFENCLEMDTTFYESYVVLGTYKFWKSRKLESLEWFPFFDDASEDGLRYLELALERTSYSKNIAAISLIWSYIDNKNFNRAIQIAENELKRNSLNRPLKWGLARAYEDVNPWKAIQVYKELITSYQNIPDQNHYQEITLKHIIAQQLAKIGEKNEALKFCNEILTSNSLSEIVREKLTDRFNRVNQLRKELSN